MIRKILNCLQITKVYRCKIVICILCAYNKEGMHEGKLCKREIVGKLNIFKLF